MQMRYDLLPLHQICYGDQRPPSCLLLMGSCELCVVLLPGLTFILRGGYRDASSVKNKFTTYCHKRMVTHEYAKKGGRYFGITLFHNRNKRHSVCQTQYNSISNSKHQSQTTSSFPPIPYSVANKILRLCQIPKRLDFRSRCI